ncbi:hypothetical protein AB0P12_25725 [Streptomyces subrutilus]|uniref:hypothetical protein n=1 Tax=Streptomyces subrutilus TaxID=36818 RepID=UPI00342604C2
MITIDIRGNEREVLEVAHRISALFLSSGPCRLRRTPGEDDAGPRHADVSRGADGVGYAGLDTPDGAVPLP